MRRLLVAHRLQVVLGAGVEQSDQGIAVFLHGLCFANARGDPRYADLHHRLIILVLQVVRLGDDHLDFVQLEGGRKGETSILDRSSK